MPDDFLTDAVQHPGNLRNHPEDHGWSRRENMDLLTQSLQVAGAVPAEPYASRMLSADYKMECPPVGRQFQVWVLPDRKLRHPGQRG